LDLHCWSLMMPDTRRAFLKASVALGAYSLATATGLIAPNTTQADWLADFFAPGTLEQTLKKTFDTTKINNSDKIELKLPSIAENGAVVPISITSTLALAEQVFILVEKNPIPLAAVFNLSPDVEAFVSTRLKIAETCNVIVVIKAAAQLYKTEQLVKVTQGGCGG
jgi:sulfur-oxidizing protein SoxY